MRVTRTGRKNKQPLMYALYSGRESIYEVDDEGNIIYGEDGEPISTGVLRPVYKDPVKFCANIAFSSGEANAEAYGMSTVDYDSKIVVPRGYLPIDETSLIFYESEPEFIDGKLDEKSADFHVMKVQPSLAYTVYLLKRVEK